MNTLVVGVLAFLGGVAIGIFGMFLSDSRYLKRIQDIYESREKRYEAKIEKQKETIDNLLLANSNKYQVERINKKG